MGKGDRKTAKGKRYNSSYGNARSKATAKAAGTAAAPAVKKTATKTVAKAEEASVLPTDIALLARGQMVTHISNVAADYMEELDLNADSMLVMAQLFSERLLGGQKVISEHEFATLKELSEK